MGSRPTAVRNSAVSDSILTTISPIGKPWTTLLGEGILGIASQPFGKDQRACDYLQLFCSQSKMATQEESSVEISQFTSTGSEEMAASPTCEEGTSWEDFLVNVSYDTPTTPMQVPEVLSNLAKKGVKFESVNYWGLEDEKPTLVKNQSIYFSVDTIITSVEILEAFDKAGIDIDEITSVQRKASNKSWVVTFDSPVTKEAALEVASVEISGNLVFLGDCEHRLVLVKVYEAPAELPDTAVIGRLHHYGRVLSFRRDKITDSIESGVRTARMELHRQIPSIINLAGELLRVWYPNQPKTCRNCGSKDHMAKDCNLVRCHNCEQPGHHKDDCSEPLLCAVCKDHAHPFSECPYVMYSANVAMQNPEEKAGKVDKRQAERDREEMKAERARKKAEYQAKQQQAHMIKGVNKPDLHSHGRGTKQRGKLPNGRSHEDPRDDKRDDRRDDRRGDERRDDGRDDRRDDRRGDERCDDRRGDDGRGDDRRGDDKHRDNRERNVDDRRDRRGRDDYYREHDHEYSRRDFHRDRSSRREDYYSDEDNGDGWTRVSYRRRRRHDY